MKKIFTIALLVGISVFLLPVSGQWVKQTIGENLTRTCGLAYGDIDGDGDMDVATAVPMVGGSGDEDVVWYENDNWSWVKHVIDDTIGGVGVAIADMDGDDIPDVINAGWSSASVKWYKNSGGDSITWTAYTIEKGFPSPEIVDVGDIDGDGDMDAVVTGTVTGIVVWFENGGDGINWTKDTIDLLTGALVCHTVDLDGDDDLDVAVTAGYGTAKEVDWYENGGDSPVSWTKHTIDGGLSGANDLVIADIDDDDDLDVFATGMAANDVVWYENGGDSPVTWTKYLIDENLTGAFGVEVADMDKNGTLDVVATGNGAGDVVWYSNDGGSPMAWTKNTIDGNLPNVWDILVCDINGDDDPDVVVNQYQVNGNIVVYRNPSIDGIAQSRKTGSLDIYPNPADEILTVQTSFSGEYSITIMSLSGQLLYSRNVEGSQHVIDLSSFSRGMYLITVRSGDMVNTQKLIRN